MGEGRTCDRALCAGCRIPTDAEHDYCPEHAPRRVKVWTARIGRAAGPDVLDVTRKSGQEGLFLAPTWEAIRPVLDARREAEECLRGANRDGAIGMLHRVAAQEILDRAWAAYRPAFLELMRASWREHRIAWLRLLARETVTLVCYCTEVDQCHRTILARELLPACGATYMGERGVTGRLDL